jgi:hypothetical protein
MAPTMATPTNFDLGASMAVLERTPAVLRALLVGLPDRWTTINEGGDTWNPMQVVAHLIHGERTDWIPRARIILAQGADREFWAGKKEKIVGSIGKESEFSRCQRLPDRIVLQWLSNRSLLGLVFSVFISESAGAHMRF